MNGSSAAGLASDSRDAARSTGVPVRIRLTGTSRILPDSVRGTSAIATISSGTWRGEQSSRSRRRDRGAQLVGQLEPVAQDDEQLHPAVGPVSGQVDDERVGHLVERQHRAVDLARPHPDAAAVDRRIRAPVDDRAAPGGDLDPVAVAPDARVHREVRVAVALAILVPPQADRHRRHRLGQTPARRPDRSPIGRPRPTPRPARRASAPGARRVRTGRIGTPPTNAVQRSVPPEVENSQVSVPSWS